MESTSNSRLFSMRLPEEDRRAIEAACEKSGLGITGQILHFCRQGLDPENVTVKVPAELKNKLEEAANTSFRTIEAQILYYIQEGVQ